MIEQEMNVFLPLPQRRQRNRNHIQAMIKILAETPFANEVEQLHVAGGDDANVNLDRIRPAQPHEFAFLDHAQKLGLRLRPDRRNLVKKNRPLIGDFKESLLRRDRARKVRPSRARTVAIQEDPRGWSQ